MPPPLAAEATLEKSVPLLLELPDELLPQPAARITLPSATASAAIFLLFPTASPPQCRPQWVKTRASSRGNMSGRCPEYGDWPARKITIGD
jgi:hypothetical protein